MKFIYQLILLCFILLFSEMAIGQFRFGGYIGGSLSQLDGDQLRGFNYTGINIGLLGGYVLNNGNSLVVDMGFNTFGSNQKSENIPNKENKILVENDIQSINILVGYEMKFGNRWDGTKDFLFATGINYHRLIKRQNSILANSFIIQNKSIPKELMATQFVAINLSLGKFLSDKLSMRFGFDYGITNLLKETQYNISQLSPYRLNFNIGYYIF